MSGFLSTAGGVIGGMFGAPKAGSAIGGAADSALQGLSGLATDVVGDMFGGGSKGISQEQKDQLQFAGVKSSLQGPTPPPTGSGAQPETSGTQAKTLDLGNALADAAKDLTSGVVSGTASKASQQIIDRLTGNDPITLAKTKGKASRAYMDAAYPEANVWDKLGQSGAAGGAVTADSKNTNERQMQQTANKQQTRIVDSQNLTSMANAGINGAISRANTHDILQQRQALINAQVADTQAAASLKAHQAGQSDAAAAASNASAAASYAAADNTRANTQTTTELRPWVVEQAKHPGKVGNVVRNLRAGTEKLFNEKKGDMGGGLIHSDSLIGQGWNTLKEFYKEQVDNVNNSGGILGATSRKHTRR